jgi:sporulation protein YlmC with PRC-barrel domain
MLYRLRKLIDLPIKATDDEIGKIKDVYFDDLRWAVRYLVVDTSWLLGRQVLISAISVGSTDPRDGVVQVRLTRNQIESSPAIDTNRPVSRQQEVGYFDHYGYPYYWNGSALWGATSNPVLPVGTIPNAPGPSGEAAHDPHLRSANEVTGYRIHTSDGSIGHVEDFLLDELSWAIRYLVVDTRNWLPGKHVVIPPQWIAEVDWSQNVVNVDVTRETVQAAPEYDSGIDFSRSQEASLYQHYQRPSYWQQIPTP